MKHIPSIDRHNWKEYSQGDSTFGFQGYLQASEEILSQLVELTSRTHSYNELKAELTEIIVKRQSFIDFAYDNMP